MPQRSLPSIPSDVYPINNVVTVRCQDKLWVYFLGEYPIHSHRKDDVRMFEIITSQLIESGLCRQVEIIKTFGVSKISVIRASKKLRHGGLEAFFTKGKRGSKAKGRRKGRVLTPEVLQQAQSLLDQNYSRRKVVGELDIKYDTLRKACKDGRLKEKKEPSSVSTKSERSMEDASAAEGMGTACTRVKERVQAALGGSEGAAVCFERCLDVPKGGVLCALPALLSNGLLDGIERLGVVKGFYTTFHILLLLAFMALSRIKTTEKLRGYSPGEFGKLLGLDRMPEVRCLRKKMNELSAKDGAKHWSAHLSKQWMNSDPEAVGALYVDGHVSVYYGHLTPLPRRYVSRQRLCLRGTTGYWVNDAVGRPFFVVEKVVDPGLLQTLEEEIVPRLLRDVPHQPSQEQLDARPWLCRFLLVFDREGYSPAFFGRMWRKHRIACMTYHKFPDEDWPQDEFAEHQVVMPGGETVKMRLCERGSFVGSGKDALWMKEVRKLNENGHQTSLLSTAYDWPKTQLAVHMFTRWSQENFFRYMRQHFALDLVMEYGTQALPDTEKVVNPVWRELERLRLSQRDKLKLRRASFAQMTMHPLQENNSTKYRNWLKKKDALQEEIAGFECEMEQLKERLKNTPKHTTWGELEQKDKFEGLLVGRKSLLDTVRMIGYRAETAMAGLLRSPTLDLPASRQLLQDLFVSEADILPDVENNILRIQVHNASRPAANHSLALLFEHLNQTETKYPGTNMRLLYELRGSAGSNP